jgi:hypothetical protein
MAAGGAPWSRMRRDRFTQNGKAGAENSIPSGHWKQETRKLPYSFSKNSHAEHEM